MDRIGHRGPKWPKKAIQAKNPIIKGVGPRGQKPLEVQMDPQAQNKGIGLGVGEVKDWPKRPIMQDMASEWCGPKAIRHQYGPIGNKNDDMANWP
ncbi:hypothetical protein O181_003523 [Austropuccinia psidii MF-1]|uniref:Uncharacterized protein n=1 Tax=Austropuccinia psidii MF-1 TaxID=1389203 RepID=A0A9Q3GDN1_9BASI|nr:hypothetical protein [Austropuccinia psidii MF-1]